MLGVEKATTRGLWCQSGGSVQSIFVTLKACSALLNRGYYARNLNVINPNPIHNYILSSSSPTLLAHSYHCLPQHDFTLKLLPRTRTKKSRYFQRRRLPSVVPALTFEQTMNYLLQK